MVMKIRILTPDRIISSTLASEIILPTDTGLVGVLENHAALITSLDTGLLRIKFNNTWTPLILCGGIAEIDQNQVTILVNDIEDVTQTNITLSEATKESEKATLTLENAKTDKERINARIEVKKAVARLEAINYLSKNKK